MIWMTLRTQLCNKSHLNPYYVATITTQVLLTSTMTILLSSKSLPLFCSPVFSLENLNQGVPCKLLGGLSTW